MLRSEAYIRYAAATKHVGQRRYGPMLYKPFTAFFPFEKVLQNGQGQGTQILRSEAYSGTLQRRRMQRDAEIGHFAKLSLFADIGFDDRRIRRHLLGTPGADQLAEIEYVDPVGDIHDHTEIVLH